MPWIGIHTPFQARTQDFERGGSEYRVAIRPRQGGGGCAPSCAKREAFTLQGGRKHLESGEALKPHPATPIATPYLVTVIKIKIEIV